MGFYLFVKDNSQPHEPPLGDKEWIEDKDGAKVISEKLYINHFFEDKISEKRSLRTVYLKAKRIYWTAAEKALARKTLGDHFGIDDIYVRQHGDNLEYYASPPFGMMWDSLAGGTPKT